MLKLKNGKEIDTRLVGKWKGIDETQKEGSTVTWRLERQSDGTFVTNYTNGDDEGSFDKFTVKGYWWIANGVFYEQFNSDDKTDSYYYEVINKDHIHFKSKSLSVEVNTETYEFNDYRDDGKKTIN